MLPLLKQNAPEGTKTSPEMRWTELYKKPLSAEDYKKADRIMLLLMQPQVKTLLDSQPGGKEKVKTIQGMFTLPEEFTNRSAIGPNNPKDVEKDTQGQKDAAEQLVHAFKNPLDLTMLNDAGYLNLYKFQTLFIGCAQSEQIGQEVLIEGGDKYTWFSRCFPLPLAYRD